MKAKNEKQYQIYYKFHRKYKINKKIYENICYSIELLAAVRRNWWRLEVLLEGYFIDTILH